MKVLIVDDEAPGRRSMRQLLRAHPDVTVAGAAATLAEAHLLLETESVDLLFLDIQLRGESGFDLLARLPDPTIRIVFVTAHDAHALRAFEVNALDYLLKPVDPQRLAVTLQRVREGLPPPRTPATLTDRVLVKSGGSLRWIPWADILLIQAEGNYTRVCLMNQERMLVYQTLKAWGERMPEGFLQIHRKTLLQSRAIARLENGPGRSHQVRLTSGEQLEVGRSYHPLLKRLLTLT